MVAVNDYSNGDIRKLPEVAKARRISNAAYVNALAEARMGLLENLGSEQSTGKIVGLKPQLLYSKEGHSS